LGRLTERVLCLYHVCKVNGNKLGKAGVNENCAKMKMQYYLKAVSQRIEPSKCPER